MASESPQKMMKNGFYFTLKAFSILNIYFFLDFLSMWKKVLTRTSKFMGFKIYDVTTWKKKLKYTYCPISQNLKAIRKTKWREEAFSRSFSKNWNWAYPWIKSRKSYNTVCFYLMPSWGLWILLKLSCRPLAFTS